MTFLQRTSANVRAGKPIVVILAACWSACFSIGCYAYRTVAVGDRDDISPTECIYKVETIDGEFVECRSDSLGCAALTGAQVRCVLEDSSVQAIPIDRVSKLYTKRLSRTATITSISLVTLIVAGLVLGVASVLRGSFPL